jgi:RHS repeat-associated protein
VDASVGYWATGSVRKASFGNNLTETLALNNRLQPCRMNVNSAGAYFSTCTDATPSGNILDLTVGYNAGAKDNGNIVSWSAVGNQTFSRTYGYDSLNRIQSLSDSASNQACQGMSWTIDAWGNMTAQTGTKGTCYNFSSSVGTNNRLQSGYQYDAAGNMTYDGTHSYMYDAENRIVQVDGGSTASYVYNENGKRARRSTGSGFTEYYYAPDGSIQVEYNGTSWPMQYVYADGKLIAQYTNSTTEFVHTDHLGSTRLVTAVNKTVLDNLDYLPFGQQNAGASVTTHKFTGKERDQESGLDNFGARYDASSMGRFMTPDPLPWLDWQHGNKQERQHFAEFISNPQNFNMYAYVDNNPTTKTDPTGMEGCKAGDKTFTTCTIKVVYDPNTSKGTLTVLGQNKGDKDPTVLLKSSVVVGGDGHVTPTGTFTATVWEKDHVSTKYGSAANTPWSKTVLGGNAFGPYQLHMKELDSQGIYIHGTMGPGWSPTTWGNNIFLSPTSHGCVRMCNRDDIALHDMMPNPSGNKVIISTKPEDPED